MLRQWFFILFLMSYSFANGPQFGSFEGTAVIMDVKSGSKEVFGTFDKERLPPCSTFKVLNSLIALDLRVVLDENETILWDGKMREYDFWNKNHTMRSAIAVSTVWFYQELARRIGEQRMQEMVLKANYGNNDTHQTLIDFWLGNGSLKISPDEQVLFLAKLMQDALPFSKRAMHTVKDILIVEKKEDVTFAGKTGSCAQTAWFVGYVQEPKSTRVFAFSLKGKGASGVEAKRIAKEYLKF